MGTWISSGFAGEVGDADVALNADRGPPATWGYVMPKNDTSGAYRDFIASTAHGELTDRERDEVRRLMVHEVIGPGGRLAISVDRELTELTRSTGATTGAY